MRQRAMNHGLNQGEGDGQARPEAVKPLRVVLVLGTSAGGTGAHVTMLAGALAGRGVVVDVLGPSATDADFGFSAVEGVEFHPVEFGDRPRPGDVAALLRLRRMLTARGGQLVETQSDTPDATRDDTPDATPGGTRDETLSQEADVVHAHGMRAGALAVIALTGRQRPRLAVTVHNAPPAGGGAARFIYLVLERIVARGATLVLCVSGDLEQRMREAGARRVGRAVIAAPEGPAPATPRVAGVVGVAAPLGAGVAASAAPERPVVLAVGRLAAQKGFGVLLRAAARWQDMDPRPRVVIAGAGPLEAELRRQAAELGVDAELPGRSDDVPGLLAAASVFVLPSLWEGQPLVLQEALRAGAPVVASRAGGIPDLTGEGAAVLVPPGQPEPLAAAVRKVLKDPALAGRLRAAARVRAASLPGADDAVTAALASYATALE